MENYKIYLDTCCFNRPFDDLSDAMVNIESEAIISIFDNCKQSKWSFFKSDILELEIRKTQDIERQENLLYMLEKATHLIELNQDIIDRSKELQKFNIKAYDALHLASAEYAEADVFLTTDKKLISGAKKSDIDMIVENPLIWLTEVIYNDEH